MKALGVAMHVRGERPAVNGGTLFSRLLVFSHAAADLTERPNSGRARWRGRDHVLVFEPGWAVRVGVRESAPDRYMFSWQAFVADQAGGVESPQACEVGRHGQYDRVRRSLLSRLGPPLATAA